MNQQQNRSCPRSSPPVPRAELSEWQSDFKSSNEQRLLCVRARVVCLTQAETTLCLDFEINLISDFQSQHQQTRLPVEQERLFQSREVPFQSFSPHREVCCSADHMQAHHLSKSHPTNSLSTRKLVGKNRAILSQKQVSQRLHLVAPRPLRTKPRNKTLALPTV